MNTTRKAPSSTIKNFLTVKTGTKAGQEIFRPNHNRTTLVVKAGIKAGGFNLNHARKVLAVKVGIKAGGFNLNHARKTLAVKAGIKAGGFNLNHARKALAVKAGIKAGGFNLNHTRTLSLRVTTGLKAGQEILRPNHSRAIVSI